MTVERQTGKKKFEQEKVERDIEAFLEGGGKIEKVDQGVGSHLKTKSFTIRRKD